VAGQELHPDLVNFMSTSSENFQNYVEKGKEADILPLFVTYADEEKFNDVKTWTNRSVTNLILNSLMKHCRLYT
jgi:hypothetical protein